MKNKTFDVNINSQEKFQKLEKDENTNKKTKDEFII